MWKCNIHLSAALIESWLRYYDWRSMDRYKNKTSPHSFSCMAYPLTSTFIALIMYWLDIVSLCSREVMIGQSYVHVLLTISGSGTVWRARTRQSEAWGDASPPGFGKLGCIQETDASVGCCTCAMWCDCGFIDVVPVPTCWQRCRELDVAAQNSLRHPTVRSAYTQYTTLYMTAG